MLMSYSGIKDVVFAVVFWRAIFDMATLVGVDEVENGLTAKFMAMGRFWFLGRRVELRQTGLFCVNGIQYGVAVVVFVSQNKNASVLTTGTTPATISAAKKNCMTGEPPVMETATRTRTLPLLPVGKRHSEKKNMNINISWYVKNRGYHHTCWTNFVLVSGAIIMAERAPATS